MIPRGSRLVRSAAIVVVLALLAACAAADMVWRWYTAVPDELASWPRGWLARRADRPMSRSGAEGGGRGRGARPRTILPVVANDPRLAPLRRAAESWRHARGPGRAVVDQVCLVPDVPSFLEAIAAWDDRHFFPILIDEPGWTLPFLRAFRPSRVLRYELRGDARASSPDRSDRWLAAAEAVARGWSPPTRPGDSLPSAGAPPRGLGRTPPGLVLSSPESPMLAGAVALAAGRFQPLVPFEPEPRAPDDPGAGGPVRYADVLTLTQAWRFARHVEGRVAAVAPRYDRLGDDCDFLTIAGDWPYRYNDPVKAPRSGGIQALDDLIGRSLTGEPDAQGLRHSRRRWAFTGRLMGDPAASVARAMAALFLTPQLALLWDTYAPRTPYASHAAAPAASLLARAGVARQGVFQAVGPGAILANWQRVMDPVNRFGLIWLNSTGGPAQFSIDGGSGLPADLPGGSPAAVVMIHSFSAADPADPATIAGRWLTQGAFVYFGSVNEPFLQAFRTPRLVADLAVRGVPLSAALRQGESEPLGRPWRLIFLGDPLYRIDGSPPPMARGERLSPESWRRLDPAYARWPAGEVDATTARPAAIDGFPPDRRLQWCRDAASAWLARAPWIAPAIAGGAFLGEWRPSPDWRQVLGRIPRESLDPRLRPILDELIVDVLSQSGEWDELQSRLSRVPPGQLRPRAWAALESGAVFRLARAARDPDRQRGRARARQLLDEVNRAPWPAGSAFPSQFAQRAQ